MNNAGVMLVPEHKKTEQGFEMTVGVNHFGHFMLTGLLLPLLAASATDAAVDTRVVAVGSIAAASGAAVKGLDFDNLNAEKGYGKIDAYCWSKLMNLLFVAQFNVWAAGRGLAVKALAAHPGYTATNLQRTMPCATCCNCCVASDVAQGALPILRAAVDPGAAAGAYFGPDGTGQMAGNPAPVPLPPAAQDAATAGKLWTVSETLTGVAFDAALGGGVTGAAPSAGAAASAGGEAK